MGVLREKVKRCEKIYGFREGERVVCSGLGVGTEDLGV